MGTEKPNTGLPGRERGKEKQDMGLGAGRRALVSSAYLREEELWPLCLVTILLPPCLSFLSVLDPSGSWITGRLSPL